MSEPGGPIEEPGPEPPPAINGKWFGPSGNCGLSCECLPVKCIADDDSTINFNPRTVTMVLTEPGVTDIKFGARSAPGDPTYLVYYLRIDDLSALLGNYVLQRNKETASFHCDSRQSVITVDIDVDVWGIESFGSGGFCPDVESYVATVTATATVTALYATSGSGPIKNFSASIDIGMSTNYEYVSGSFVALGGGFLASPILGDTILCSGGTRTYTVQPAFVIFEPDGGRPPCPGYISTVGLSLAYSFDELCDV